MRAALVTGGSGFFGGILKRALLERGWKVVNIDLVEDEDRHENLTSIKGDIRDRHLLHEIFSKNWSEGAGLAGPAPGGHHIGKGWLVEGKPLGSPSTIVFHCAAILAHAVSDRNFLWSSNIDGTRVVAEAAKAHNIKKIIFTSSNCLWGEPLGRPVREDDKPNPVEIYGKSKWEGEKILREFDPAVTTVTIRCPTIIEEGRLGLLAILFEFIDEGRKVWVVGGGDNRYQFIAAPDLVEACIKAADYPRSATFGIGSDNVKTLREVYEDVIARTGTKSRVARLPRAPTLLAMRIAYALGISPLGPYQYKMIAESFAFDTSAIKKELDWHPRLTNSDMLYRAYEYYHRNRKEIESRTDASAHRSAAKMGIIRLLKWIS